MRRLEGRHRGAGKYLPTELWNQPDVLLQVGVPSLPRQRALVKDFLKYMACEAEEASGMHEDELATHVLNYVTWRLSQRKHSRRPRRWAYSSALTSLGNLVTGLWRFSIKDLKKNPTVKTLAKTLRRWKPHILPKRVHRATGARLSAAAAALAGKQPGRAGTNQEAPTPFASDEPLYENVNLDIHLRRALYAIYWSAEAAGGGVPLALRGGDLRLVRRFHLRFDGGRVTVVYPHTKSGATFTASIPADPGFCGPAVRAMRAADLVFPVAEDRLNQALSEALGVRGHTVKAATMQAAATTTTDTRRVARVGGHATTTAQTAYALLPQNVPSRVASRPRRHRARVPVAYDVNVVEAWGGEDGASDTTSSDGSDVTFRSATSTSTAPAPPASTPSATPPSPRVASSASSWSPDVSSSDGARSLGHRRRDAALRAARRHLDRGLVALAEAGHAPRTSPGRPSLAPARSLRSLPPPPAPATNSAPAARATPPSPPEPSPPPAKARRPSDSEAALPVRGKRRHPPLGLH